MNINDWIGFVGVSIILIAYFLNITNRLSKDGIIYILLNFTGGALACLASVLINYLPFIILEGAWTIISFISLLKYVNIRKRHNSFIITFLP